METFPRQRRQTIDFAGLVYIQSHELTYSAAAAIAMMSRFDRSSELSPRELTA